MSLLLILFCLSIAQIVEYRLWKNYGQVIYDYSGNNNHGKNGRSELDTVKDCLFTDRGAYLSSVCFIKFPEIHLPNPVSIVIWAMPEGIIQTGGTNIGRLFCRWSQSQFFFIFHDKLDSRVKLEVMTYGDWIQEHSSSNTWKSSNQYLDEWILIITEIDQNIYKIKKNSETILEFSDSSIFVDGPDSTLRSIHIGSDNMIYTSFGGFVWYASIFSMVNIQSNFLSTASNNCFVGTCTTCDPSFVIPSLGTGCASNSINPTTDSKGNNCNSEYGCKGNSIIKCNCPSLSCEFTSEIECSCIESTSNTKYQAACECSKLGQGCCHDDCASCSIELICLTCKASFTHIIDGKCICNDGYYKDPLSSSLKCLPCMIECKTCSNETICTSCRDSLALLVNSRCYCPSGYFNLIDSNISRCSSCLPYCKTCKGSSNCLSCDDQYQPINIDCSCAEGYYKDSGFCIKCSKSCKTCLNSTYCLTCNSLNSRTNNGTCECLEGFYKNSFSKPQNLICDPCVSPCKTCLSFKKCLSCDFNKVLNNRNACICNKSYYLDENKDCIKCNETCATCISKYKCKTCKDDSFELVNNSKCLKQCLNNMIRINELCGCPPGYKIQNSSCVEYFFHLKLNHGDSNKLSLVFNEALKKSLKDDRISISFNDGKYLKFKLLSVSPSKVLLIFQFDQSIKNGTNITVKLQEPIYSKNNAVLKNYNLNATLFEYIYIDSAMRELIKKSGNAIKIISAISIAISIVSNPAVAWAMIGTLQLLHYIPLSKNYDEKVTKIFFTSVGEFNFLPNYAVYVLNEDSATQPSQEVRSIGIKTSVFWINSGKIILPLIMLIMMRPIFGFIHKIGLVENFDKKLQRILKNYKFSVFLRFWIQAYLDLGVFSIIGLKAVF